MLRDGSLTAFAGGTGQPSRAGPFFGPIAKALSRLPPPLVLASIPGPRIRSRAALGQVSYDGRSPPGRAGASFHGSFCLLHQSEETPQRIQRRRAGAASRRARPGSAFGQPNTDRRVRLVCLSSGPDPKADGLLERPGEAFCPAKSIKLGLEGLASSPDPALGALAPVIDARRTLRPPRNPSARRHEARFQRRAEPRGRGFRTHRSSPEPRGARIQR